MNTGLFFWNTKNLSILDGISATDLLGNIVLIQKTNSIKEEIDMQNYSSGIYIVKVKTIEGLNLFKLRKE